MNVSILLMSAALAAPQTGSPGLPPELRRVVNETVDAYHRGQPDRMLRLLGSTIEKVERGAIDRMSKSLELRKVPSVGQLIAEARLIAVQQNLTNSLPKMGLKERLFLAPEFRALIGQRLEKIRAAPQLRTQPEDVSQPDRAADADKPRTLDGFEKQLWSLHVLDNEVMLLERSTHYAIGFAKQTLETHARLLNPDQVAILERVIKTPVVDIYRLRAQVVEAEMVKRLERLEFASAIAADLDRKLSYRMRAVFAVAHDALVLQPFADGLLTTAGLAKSLQSEQLREPNFAKTVKRLTDETRAAAGDLWDQSQRLLVGLHWWVRGRFGKGPEFWGLAKSAAALENTDALNWLYMPRIREWDDKKFTPEVPFERRHHSTWAAQDRRVETKIFRHQVKKMASEELKLSTFW